MAEDSADGHISAPGREERDALLAEQPSVRAALELDDDTLSLSPHDLDPPEPEIPMLDGLAHPDPSRERNIYSTWPGTRSRPASDPAPAVAEQTLERRAFEPRRSADRIFDATWRQRCEAIVATARTRADAVAPHAGRLRRRAPAGGAGDDPDRR